MDEEITQKNKGEKNDKGNVKVFHGTVTSDKMQGTAVVEVSQYLKHPKYGKYVKKSKKYKVDDPNNRLNVGQKVIIESSKPLSKGKRFKIHSIE